MIFIPLQEHYTDYVDFHGKNITNTFNSEVLDYYEERGEIFWDKVCVKEKLTCKFMNNFPQYINFKLIQRYQKLEEWFIETWIDMFDLNLIVMFQNHLSEQFIVKYQYRINWRYICKYLKLSEDFMFLFKEKIDWNIVSKYQKLSEGFIEYFKHFVNWKKISKYQKLSEKFIERHLDKIDLIEIFSYQPHLSRLWKQNMYERVMYC